MIRRVTFPVFERCSNNGLFLFFHNVSTSSSTSIDVEEQTNFKQFSNSWWDKEGEMKPLHSMNKVRVPFIRDGLINTGIVKKDYINSAVPLKNMKILDVGCGGGILSEALARLGANVIGIDGTKELIEIAERHANLDESLKNIVYIEESVESHVKQSRRKYDAVLLSEVVEHISEKDKFLDCCVECLKPGGSLFITTISKTNIAWFGAIVLAEKIMKLIPSETHHWEKFIEPRVLQGILVNYNCKTRLIHGLLYNPLTNTWHWTSNTQINYAFHAIKGM